MLNDDSADSKKSPPSRPSQSHPTLPSVPQLQTAHSSAISNTYTQSPVVGTPQAYPPSYAQTPHLDRRSSSHQSQSQYAQTGTPMTPHTPAHHPGYAQQGYFTHAHQPSPSYAPRSSSSYARSENSQPPPGYVASPQSYPNVAPSTPFGPSLRDPDGLMQPPRESPIARRHGSAVLTQPVTPGPPYAPSIPAQYRPPLSESPITNGRESLSVSPKTLPNTLPPRSRESSVRYESATPDQLKRSSDAGESKSGERLFSIGTLALPACFYWIIHSSHSLHLFEPSLPVESLLLFIKSFVYLALQLPTFSFFTSGCLPCPHSACTPSTPTHTCNLS